MKNEYELISSSYVRQQLQLKVQAMKNQTNKINKLRKRSRNSSENFNGNKKSLHRGVNLRPGSR